MILDNILGSIRNEIATESADSLFPVAAWDQFKKQGQDPKTAPIYAQMLVGMVALTGQWWLDARSPSKNVVAAHLVNLAWNGLSALERRPTLSRT